MPAISKTALPAERTNSYEYAMNVLAAGKQVVNYIRQHPIQALCGALMVQTASVVRATSSEFIINSYTNSYQYTPAMTPLNDGNFMTVWTSFQDFQTDGIFGQILGSTGNKVIGPFTVNTNTNNAQSDPAITMLSNGEVVASWVSDNGQDGSQDGVFAQRLSNTGVKQGSEFQINNYSIGYQTDPQVASSPNGNFLTVYQSYINNFYRIYGRLYNSAGATIAPEFRIDNWDTNHHQNPVATSFQNGDYIAAWYTEGGRDGDGQGIYARIISGTGAIINNDFKVNTAVLLNQLKPAIATLGNNNVVITWVVSSSTSMTEIRGQIVDGSANLIGSEFQVSSTPLQGNASDRSTDQWVSKLDANHFIVTWFNTGTNVGIYAQVLNNQGIKIGVEFQVNTPSASILQVYDPYVITLANGNAVLSWAMNNNQSSFDVYGRIIDPSLSATNINQNIIYVENTPQSISAISITAPIFMPTITAQLTLSDPLAGTLNTATSSSGTVSTYISGTGVWQASGPLAEVNELLSGLQFSPTSGMSTDFTIGLRISDGFNPDLTDTMIVNGVAAPTTAPTTTLTQTSTQPSPQTSAQTPTPTTEEPTINTPVDYVNIIGGVVGGIASLIAIPLGIFGIYKGCKTCKKNDDEKLQNGQNNQAPMNVLNP